MKHKGFLIGWQIGALIGLFLTINLRAYAASLILGLMIWILLEAIAIKKENKELLKRLNKKK